MDAQVGEHRHDVVEGMDLVGGSDEAIDDVHIAKGPQKGPQITAVVVTLQKTMFVIRPP